MHQCSASDEGLDCGERLIGREVELDRIRRAFARSRLVTIIGDGGIGKTSLARAYARNAGRGGEAPGRDGVAFVSLAAASSPGEVPGLVADALGVRLRPGVEPGAAIALSLSGAEGAPFSLVVLDNFEHLLYASRFVEGLREACPAISMLVTSRVGLGLRGERLMPLAGLSLRLEGRDAGNGDGEPLAPALRLMVERIRNASPRFSPSAEEEAALLDLCRRLEGNPLSIVLAAARIAMNPELARSSPDTLLDFVASPGGKRGGRHASLEDTLEWSYRLLPSPPRVLLAELGAFTGRVSLRSLQAASSLGPDLTEALAELERTGFLRIEARSGAKIGDRMIGDADSDVARPEAVAEFSSRLLARAPFRARALEAREALYAELSAQADAEAASGASGPASARLLVELPSLRDAVARAAGEGDRRQAASIALAAYRTLQAEGRYAEGLALTEACLEGSGALDEAVAARLSWREAGFLFRLGRLEEAAESLSGAGAAAARLGDEAFLAELQASLAVAFLELGRFEEAEAAFLSAESLAAKRGDRRLAMRIAVNRGLSADLRGDFESAGLRYGEAEALARSLGDAPSLGLVLKNAAARLWRLARYEESVVAYREALAVIEPTGIAYAQAAARIGLGYALARLGRPAEARAELDAAFALSRAAGVDDSPSPESCLAYAELAEASGDAAEARELVAEALRVAARGGERRLLPPALEAAARYLPGEASARAARLAGDIRERLRLPVPPCEAPAARAGGAPETVRPTPGPVAGWLEAYAEALSLAEGLCPARPRRGPGNAVADGPAGR